VLPPSSLLLSYSKSREMETHLALDKPRRTVLSLIKLTLWKVWSLAPKNQNNLGDLLDDQGRSESAIKSLRKALRVAPN